MLPSATACSASLEDQPITFTVTQTDDDGNVQIDGDNTFVDVATVAGQEDVAQSHAFASPLRAASCPAM
jgi:hypothetical protein